MIDLDTRARAAAAGLKATVATGELRLADLPPGTTPGRPPWTMFAAGAAVAGAVVVATVVDLPEIEEPVTASTVTTIDQPTTTGATASTTTTPTGTPAPVVTVPETTTSTVDTTPPPITITEPADGSETEDERITFRGTTEPGAMVFAGDYQASVAADGSWSIVLLLSPGETTARFVAIDAAGNEASATVTVTLVVPEPETTTTTKPNDEEPETTTTTKPTEEEVASFTANASFGTCAEDPPWDVYYGTGVPGSVVEISSPYGSGRTEVGSSGQWEVQVFFPEAPLGKTFEVLVEDSLGRKSGFAFTHTEA